jgi:hypothetical protein
MFKSKYDLWFENQNEATKTYLENRSKEDSKLIMLGWWLGVTSGSLLTILIYSML